MRYKILVFLFLMHSAAFAQQLATVDVQHYNFEIEINDNNDTIIGNTTIKLTTKTTGNIMLNFDVLKKLQGKGMIINSLKVDNKETDFETLDEKIVLPNKEPKNAQLTIIITYKGIPANGLIISKNKFGERTFFGDNWPNRAHFWLPCVDDIADKATVKFSVIAPVDYTIVSNGSLISTIQNNNTTTTTYTSNMPLATKVIVFGAAKFAVQKAGEVNGITVLSYLYQKDSTNGFKDYAKAVPILQWFINNVGAYNYTKLANVQSTTMFGGMENASAIFYNETEISGNYDNEDLLAHEIAHQWFGNTVTEKSFEHLWLSEGFATYFASLYMKHAYGQAVFMKRMIAEKEKVYKAKVNGPIVNSNIDYMSLLNAYSYQKGAWVLYMLHNKVGDTAFFNFIKAYYKKYRNSNVDSDDFLAEVKNSFNAELVAFLKQYLYQIENPEIEVYTKYNKTKKSTTIYFNQTTKYLFNLPVKVTYTNSNEDFEKMYILTKKKQQFVLPVGSIVKTVKVNLGEEVLVKVTLK
jgi:aminopeptidase N